MSLNTNITNLQEILDKVNNLPEAGPSTPELTPLILNKVDSIGDFNHSPKTRQTIEHIVDFDVENINKVIVLLDVSWGDAPDLSKYFSILDGYRVGINQINSVLGYLDYEENFNPGRLTLSFPDDNNFEGQLKLTFETNANSQGEYDTPSSINIIALGKDGQVDNNTILIPYVYWPCYLKNTLITLANNQTKKVQDITYQDDLLVWDFNNGCYASAKPLWIKQSQIATQYYHCVFEDNSTLDLVGGRGHAHRIFCLNTNRFEYANDCIGKIIMTQNGPMKLLSCDVIEDNVEFYNIITDYHMNCFANKVLTSTGFSNIYPIENMKYIVDTNREIIPIEAFTNCPEEYYYGMRLGEQVNYTMERMNEKIQNMAAIALPKGE